MINRKVLYFGSGAYGSTSYLRSNIIRRSFKCLHHLDSRIVFPDRSLGRSVLDSLSVRLGIGSLAKQGGTLLIDEAKRYLPDIIWIDGGIFVDSASLGRLKELFPRIYLLHYTPDSLFAPAKNTYKFKRSLIKYDLCVTTKTQDLKLYEKFSNKYLKVEQGFSPDLVSLLESEGCCTDRGKSVDIIFVGAYMRDRAKALSALVRKFPDKKIEIYGSGWSRWYVDAQLRMKFKGGVFGNNYYRAIANSKIVLGFLNNKVHDTVTTRTYEIPAVGSFLLAERTDEHQQLLSPGVEADFFSSHAELIDKVAFYLENQDLRENIAFNGKAKISKMDYTWEDSVKRIIHAMSLS